MSFRLCTLFADIRSWFEGPKAKAAEATIASLMPAAVAIVNDIAALAPNRTTEEFAAIANKYVLPTVSTIAADPTQAENVMLNLGTAILAKNFLAPAAAATSLLNTIIQLAVTSTKTTDVPPAHLIGNGAMGGAPVPTPA